MRRAFVERKSSETDIRVELNIDGSGKYEISTSIPFFDHMLSLMAKHALFDLFIHAKGDVDVDYHHTVEDVGICLGEALKKAVGDKRGINRYGEATVPMDETLAQSVVDLSGRPYLVYNVDVRRKRSGKFDMELIETFLQAFCVHGGVTIHINLIYGRNMHHIAEAIFKSLGRAIKEATREDERLTDVPSTKGFL